MRRLLKALKRLQKAPIITDLEAWQGFGWPSGIWPQRDRRGEENHCPERANRMMPASVELASFKILFHNTVHSFSLIQPHAPPSIRVEIIQLMARTELLSPSQSALVGRAPIGVEVVESMRCATSSSSNLPESRDCPTSVSRAANDSPREFGRDAEGALDAILPVSHG